MEKVLGEARRLDEVLTRHLLLLDMVPRQEATRQLRREETRRVEALCQQVSEMERRAKDLLEEVAAFETGPVEEAESSGPAAGGAAGGLGAPAPLQHKSVSAVLRQQAAQLPGLPSPFSSVDSDGTPVGGADSPSSMGLGGAEDAAQTAGIEQPPGNDGSSSGGPISDEDDADFADFEVSGQAEQTTTDRADAGAVGGTLDPDANVAQTGEEDEDFADFEEAGGEPPTGAAGEEERTEQDSAAGV